MYFNTHQKTSDTETVTRGVVIKKDALKKFV